MPKTILLADDSSTIRKIVELTFNGTDIRVESFDSGAAALENMDRVKPDLIMVDVVMPGPTGYDLCKHVKAVGASIPVVLLSSAFEPYDHDLALACGADRHLIKPFESRLLKATVRELLEPQEPKPAAATISVDEVTDEAARAAQALLEETYASLAEEESRAPDQEPHDELDERLVDAVSRAVVGRLSEQVVREIATEVVPDLAERIIRERIRQLERDKDS